MSTSGRKGRVLGVDPTTLPPPPSHRRRTILIVLALLAVGLGVLFIRFVLATHRLRDRLATGPSWSFPSRIYSDALVLEPGRSLPPDYLRAELEIRGYRETREPREPGEWASRGNDVEIFLRGLAAAPPAPGAHGKRSAPGAHAEPAGRVRLRLAGGRLIQVRRLSGRAGAGGLARLEPMRIATLADSEGVIREWVPLASIAPVMRRAVIAAEDRRFYRHHGLDARSNARALAANLKAGAVRQGGSTITQQLARGLFLGRERSVRRKLHESLLALGLELVLSKDHILEMYLNSVYFGPGEGERIAGVAEAAARFFGVRAGELTLDQAALLVGIIPAPGAFSPLRNPALALRQRNRVLRDMLATGAIDAKTARAAMDRPLGLEPTGRPGDRFPSFVGYVREELRTRLPRGAAEGWGLTVLTTLDPVWQERAEQELGAGVAEEDWRGDRDAPLQGAFVALDPASGEVRAMVGGRESVAGDFNRAIRAYRQPGSAIKPIVYAAALDPSRGAPRFTPGSTVPDLRRDFPTPEGPWSPRNDRGEYHETATLAKALVHSLNVATANLVQAIGPATVSRYAERFGLGRPQPVASIGLGTKEVTPLALTAAMAVFANGGMRHDPTALRAVLDARGRSLHAAAPAEVRVLPGPTAALMRGLLESVVIFGIAYPLRAEYGFTRPCGGKTGTSNDYRDAWFVGFTPELAAGVWVGYDTPQSLGAPAARVALPVWARVVKRLLEGFPPAPFPDRGDVQLAWIDPWTGGLARRDCPHPLRTPFLVGTAPRAFCTRDHAEDWDAIAAKALADSLREAGADSAAADSSGD